MQARSDGLIGSDTIDEAIVHYGGATPRYTSYPTAVELKPCTFDLLQFGGILKPGGSTPRSLYVHIPFCRSLCYFCACNKIITDDPALQSRYVMGLGLECRLIREAAGEKLPLGSIHFGGGSPSVLLGHELEELLGGISENFGCGAAIERSIELDPRTTTDALVDALCKLGFSRVSLGVQDFDETVQQLVNRRQSYEMVAGLVSSLRIQGIEKINFDLIYGLPGQTENSILNTIEKVLSLRPSRIALYGYAHVSWKSKTQRVFNKYPLPSPAERYRIFEAAKTRLIAAGYCRIGLDHFALPEDCLTARLRAGLLRRNFMGYTSTDDERVVGIGASSISDSKGWIYQNAVDIHRYLQAVERGIPPIEKALRRTEDDQLRSWIIERIMCDCALDSRAAPFERHVVDAALGEAARGLDQMERRRLIRRSPTGFEATELGRFFIRSIAALFDVYSGAHTDQKFSRGA